MKMGRLFSSTAPIVPAKRLRNCSVIAFRVAGAALPPVSPKPHAATAVAPPIVAETATARRRVMPPVPLSCR
jgi:hypothetical protein